MTIHFSRNMLIEIGTLQCPILRNYKGDKCYRKVSSFSCMLQTQDERERATGTARNPPNISGRQ